MQKEQMSRVYGESFIVNGMMLDAILMSFLTIFQSYQVVVGIGWIFMIDHQKLLVTNDRS